MTELFRGDYKKGAVIEHEGKTYISEGSRHYNAHEMEDGFDIFMETGYYSTAHEAVSAEDMQLVQAHKGRESAKQQAFEEKQRQAYAGAGTFAVGQRIRYKNVKIQGTIIEIDPAGRLRIQDDGKKSASWIQPGFVEAL